MFGLSFQTLPAVEPAHPSRADIALFVGWTTRRAGQPLPPAIADWLRERRYPLDDSLRDVPVPIDAWGTFDALFDGQARPLSAGGAAAADDYLSLAVRDFFANGGRKAYVVRLGDPWPVLPQLAAEARASHLTELLPPEGAAGWMRESWHGIEHAWALDDLSFVLVPDLPALLADRDAVVPPDAPAAPVVPEVFVECAPSLQPALPAAGVRRVAAPRLSDEAYAAWNDTAQRLRERLARRRRDLMLLLALPLAAADTRAARRLQAAVSVRSSMLQLATPWLQPLRPPRVPEGLLPPDGALAGLVAGSVLQRGAARTAAGAAPRGVRAVWPQPPDEALRTPDPAQEDDALVSRFALFAPTPDGVRLRSDRSASALRAWRDAGVVRLLGQLLRTARQVGETLVFEPAGEALWARLQGRFEQVLTRYWQAGALRGASAAEAFDVRCDRSTMTQNDLDHGRVVVQLSFVPQAGIERIRVALALAEDGGVRWADADAVEESVA